MDELLGDLPRFIPLVAEFVDCQHVFGGEVVVFLPRLVALSEKALVVVSCHRGNVSICTIYQRLVAFAFQLFGPFGGNDMVSASEVVCFWCFQNKDFFLRSASIFRRSGVAVQNRLQASLICLLSSSHQRSSRSEPQVSVPAAPVQTLARLERDFFIGWGCGACREDAVVEGGEAVSRERLWSGANWVEPFDFLPHLAVLSLFGLDGDPALLADPRRFASVERGYVPLPPKRLVECLGRALHGFFG